MPGMRACRIMVRGRVQGVNFRRFAQRKALELGLAGFARNLPDGATVEVYAEGSEDGLVTLIRAVGAGPPMARVDSVDEAWSEPQGCIEGFRVL